MLSYVWRNLLTRKIRTALSVLGVSASVAGIVALISIAYGMRSSIDAYMEGGGASLIVYSGHVADLIFSSVKQEELDAIAAWDDVEDVSRSHFFMVKPPAPLDGGESDLAMLFCFGRYRGERMLEQFATRLTEGGLFRNKNEIIASVSIADALGWKLNDEVEVFPGQAFKVVGLYESPSNWEQLGVMMDADVLGEKLGRRDNYNIAFIYCKTADGARSADEISAATAAAIQEKYPHLKAIKPGEFTSSFKEQLAIMDEFIAMITVIALVVGVLGVLNTMMMSVHERTREIGMLRALGWSRGWVIKLILLEGVVLCAIGGAFGLLFGYLGSELLIAAYPQAHLVAVYLPSTFVKGGIVAFAVGLLAALYPAYAASNLRPVVALRYE